MQPFRILVRAVFWRLRSSLNGPRRRMLPDFRCFFFVDPSGATFRFRRVLWNRTHLGLEEDIGWHNDATYRWKRPGLATRAASGCIYDTQAFLLHPSRHIFLLFIGCDRRIVIGSGCRHGPGRACAGRPGRTAIAQRHRDGVAPPARQRDRR